MSITCCLGLTIGYVGVLYVHPRTRPSSTVFRNDNAVIKARVTAITFSSTLSAVATAYILTSSNKFSISRGLDAIRVWPVPPIWELLRSSMLVTSVLFIGPLVEKLILNKGWKYLREDLTEGLTGWIGIRNYIVGPFTEELVFRACIVSIELQSGMSPVKSIWVSPLYFATAHIHHAYEVYTESPDALSFAIISSLFQFGFTTLFGWYSTFLFLRTGSVWPPFIAHAFCNSMGVPRLGARLEGPAWYTHLYNALLVGGAISFGLLLYPLTKTPNAII
ncbi:CAAX protease self-immunity-domain-containing protein [Lipomyces arxii]|uniref:CAAX protease self-immunity-domain-containing protein n=1 Tax=Lipomyces arxii TaxID=56418 RepID=UPI0034CF2323